MSQKYLLNRNTYFKNVQNIFLGRFGLGGYGHIISAQVLNNSGIISSAATIGSTVELSDGNYCVPITFTAELNGYVKITDTTDNIVIYYPFLSVDIGAILGNFVKICRIIDLPYIKIKTLTES